MTSRQTKRLVRELTLAEKERLERYRAALAQEAPELEIRARLRREASAEPTLCGELRRAVHASELSLAEIAAQSGIPPLSLDEFLTAERTLRSDSLDRLALALGFEFSPR